MPQYQIYCLTNGGMLVEARRIVAENDATAIAEALTSPLTNGCEVWEGDRLLARLEMIGHGRGYPCG
jgi:hypothetical protein